MVTYGLQKGESKPQKLGGLFFRCVSLVSFCMNKDYTAINVTTVKNIVISRTLNPEKSSPLLTWWLSVQGSNVLVGHQAHPTAHSYTHARYMHGDSYLK